MSEWITPLDYARSTDTGEHWALLYSGMNSQGSGRYSYLATHPQNIIDSGGFAALQNDVNDGRWFGYLGYGLRHELEDLTHDEPSFISTPDVCFFKPGALTCFDHETESVAGAQHTQSIQPFTPPKINVTSLTSNMSKAEYLQSVEQTLEQIHQGAFYQANITRKFYGEFDQAPNAFALFERLCNISPSPFAAYIQMGDIAIISSSPEGFLSIDEAGQVISRPIKGSAPRGDTTAEDKTILQSLKDSHKDRAENLMIVDLMRNDLSRACEPGSVEVSYLQEVHSFETIHQMISTITGTRAADQSTFDVIKACFPPGSMTGAPKIAAMNWCAKQEKLARGIYSGALGWIDANGACDLSVVIRTLIIQGNRFEFQVGGGIVADSDPLAEWEESLLKATAIAQMLGITLEHL